ncbi:MAG: hypothetical protein IJT98_09560 [Prevotella sp.]|nr:hypothetical protein [Prevotella sp.]
MHIKSSFFCLFIAILATACSHSPVLCLLPADAELKEGDVVFRRGGGLTSHAVLVADRKGQYSHVGIVVDSCGTLLVVHAVPGEPDFEGDPDRVKADRPEHFFSSEYTSIGEVCRPRDEHAAAVAAQAAWQAYQRHTLFDHDYDDSDTTKMYCTELVAYAYRHAGIDLVEDRGGHYINLPFLQGECVYPSDIYQSDFLTSVIKF